MLKKEALGCWKTRECNQTECRAYGRKQIFCWFVEAKCEKDDENIPFMQKFHRYCTTCEVLSNCVLQKLQGDNPEKMIQDTFRKISEQCLNCDTGYENLQKRLVHLGDKLSQLHEISDLMLSNFNEDKVIHIILTAVTAGEGLAINRAFLFIVDDDTSTLRGRMAVGHLNLEEALKSWRAISERGLSLHDIIEAYDKTPPEKRDTAINNSVKQIQIPLDKTNSVLIQAILERKSFNEVKIGEASKPDRDFMETFNLSSFAIVPLIRDDRAIGVLLVDNFITKEPIPDEYIELLKLYANHAALAIVNARLLDNLEGKMDELTKAYEVLEKQKELEKFVEMGRMAADIAHEIKNPLVSIGGFARYVHRHLADEVPQYNEPLQIVISETNRLENILKNLLSFARPPEPHLELNDVNKAVCDTLAVIKQEMERQNIESKTLFDEKQPQVWLDRQQIHQVLLNIYRNALQAMPDGGTLTTQTEVSGNFANIKISDTGIGIPEESMSYLFDPFFTTKSAGTGLGLSIAQQVVANHSGVITPESVAGEGSTFTISLPLERRSR